jgi:hypothetical protein
MPLNPLASEFVPPSTPPQGASPFRSVPVPIKSSGKPRSSQPQVVEISTWAGVVCEQVSPTKLGPQLSLDLQFDDVFEGGHSLGHQSSVTSGCELGTLEQQLSSVSLAEEATTAEAEAVIHEAQLELECDGPVQIATVTNVPNGLPAKAGPHDFDILRVVGQGAFGKVRHWPPTFPLPVPGISPAATVSLAAPSIPAVTNTHAPLCRCFK